MREDDRMGAYAKAKYTARRVEGALAGNNPLIALNTAAHMTDAELDRMLSQYRTVLAVLEAEAKRRGR